MVVGGEVKEGERDEHLLYFLDENFIRKLIRVLGHKEIRSVNDMSVIIKIRHLQNIPGKVDRSERNTLE